MGMLGLRRWCGDGVEEQFGRLVEIIPIWFKRLMDSDYIIYVDESGDHSLDQIDAQYPVFVLSFCIFDQTKYRSQIVPGFLEIKFKHWGHDMVIFRNYSPPIFPYGGIMTGFPAKALDIAWSAVRPYRRPVAMTDAAAA